MPLSKRPSRRLSRRLLSTHERSKSNTQKTMEAIDGLAKDLGWKIPPVGRWQKGVYLPYASGFTRRQVEFIVSKLHWSKHETKIPRDITNFAAKAIIGRRVVKRSYEAKATTQESLKRISHHEFFIGFLEYIVRRFDPYVGKLHRRSSVRLRQVELRRGFHDIAGEGYNLYPEETEYVTQTLKEHCRNMGGQSIGSGGAAGCYPGSPSSSESDDGRF